MQMRIIEVICSAAESIDFELCEKVLGYFLQQPIDNHAAFDAALAVQDEDYFCEVR
jgi:hypothetical protein